MSELASDEFVAAVISHLPHNDINSSAILDLYKQGFTVSDAVSYCMCMEDFSPELDEDVAIKRMRELREKYK